MLVLVDPTPTQSLPFPSELTAVKKAHWLHFLKLFQNLWSISLGFFQVEATLKVLKGDGNPGATQYTRKHSGLRSIGFLKEFDNFESHK